MVATLSTTSTISAFDVNSTEVVWEETVSSATQVWSVPIAGGSPSLLATLPASVPAEGVLADDHYVYAGIAEPANGTTVGARGFAGGPPSQNISLAANGAQATLFVSPDGGLPPLPSMLFGDGTSVYSCAYSGSSYPTLTPSLTRTPSSADTPVILTASCSATGYAFDAANAYWTVVTFGTPGTTTIHATSLTNGGDVTLGSTSPGGGTESPLASNGQNLVLALQAGSNNPTSVYVVPVTGGTPTAIYSAGTADPIVVGADSSFAYLVQTSDFTTASVIKIPLGGGTAFTIGTGLLGSSSNGYIITPSVLYWLETSGTVTTVWSLHL
jgi:hypothetical protein